MFLHKKSRSSLRPGLPRPTEKVQAAVQVEEEKPKVIRKAPSKRAKVKPVAEVENENNEVKNISEDGQQ